MMDVIKKSLEEELKDLDSKKISFYINHPRVMSLRKIIEKIEAKDYDSHLKDFYYDLVNLGRRDLAKKLPIKIEQRLIAY